MEIKIDESRAGQAGFITVTVESTSGKTAFVRAGLTFEELVGFQGAVRAAADLQSWRGRGYEVEHGGLWSTNKPDSHGKRLSVSILSKGIQVRAHGRIAPDRPGTENATEVLDPGALVSDVEYAVAEAVTALFGPRMPPAPPLLAVAA